MKGPPLAGRLRVPRGAREGVVMVERNLRITEAAVRLFDGKTYTGKRHGQIMQAIWKDHPKARITDDMQGFISQDGQFWNRFQAGAIAFQAGQTATRREHLLSEDLW